MSQPIDTSKDQPTNATSNSTSKNTPILPSATDADDILASLGINVGQTQAPKPKKKNKKKSKAPSATNDKGDNNLENTDGTKDSTNIDEGDNQKNKSDQDVQASQKTNKKKKPEPKKSAQALKILEEVERKRKELEEKKRYEDEIKKAEEDRKRQIAEEQERLKAIRDEKKRKKKEKIEKQKKEGTYLTAAQKKKNQREIEARERLIKFTESQSKQAKEVVSINEVMEKTSQLKVDDSIPKKAEEINQEDVLPQSWEDIVGSEEEVEEEEEESEEEQEKITLRAAICCVLGHVDTGKTKILDRIRHTNVQEGEAGGITQQIGATFFPIESLSKSIDTVRQFFKFEYEIPGLLMIDTPGHESFSNLRSRGSSLCDIAILVVDIMHGLEKQTIESLNLLIAKKCPFVVALNKIDRIYGWQKHENESFLQSIKKQSKSSQEEFNNRLKDAKLAFNEKGFNAELYTENTDPIETISLIPTSAVTGEGIPDLLGYMTYICQKDLKSRFIYREEVDCTVLELKTTEGFGTTIDVILVNGTLCQGDRIVLCGLNGPIITEIRVLLTPEPMREIRTKSAYIKHNKIRAAMGIRISATDLDECVPGTPLFVCNDDDRLDYFKNEVTKDLNKLKMNFKKTEEGVWVQSSSLGSLEALLDFLSKSKPSVPVCGYNIGPLRKRDITEASVVLNRKPEYGVILAFDIKIDNEIELLIKQAGLRLFSEQIIYRLFDSFTVYMDEITDKKHKVNDNIIYPCELKCVEGINHKDPIIIGVDVIQGSLKVGTPIAAIKIDGDDRKIVELGKISSIQLNKQNVDNIKPGGNSVAISVAPTTETQKKMQFGKTFDMSYALYSRITRASIDVMKTTYRDKLQPSDWLLMKQLKEYYNII